MHPLEPRIPQQDIKLGTLCGTLVCLGLSLLSGGIIFLLESPHHTGIGARDALRLLWLFGASAFVVRLFQWCAPGHVLKAASASLILLLLTGIVLSPDQPALAITTSSFAFIGLLIAGNIGMSIGGFASRRTADAQRSSLIRALLAAVVLGLVLGRPIYGCAITALSVRKAERAGAAPLKADAAALARTVIVPTLEVPVTGGTNVIWCGTLQLAWNELRALAGEEIRMEHQDPAVDALNRGTLVQADLDRETYVTAATRADDRALRNLHEQVRKKFRGAITPELIPAPNSLPEDAFVLYAILFANLPFDTAFKRLTRPFDFGGTPVAAFGTEGDLGSPLQARKIRAQVNVLDVRGADDFVIELKTKRKRHQLILAKVPPERTLEKTAQSVLARVVPAQPPSRPSAYKHLLVPIADYDLSRPYNELTGRPLIAREPTLNNNPLVSVVQSIRFKLDESGAVLKSEARICVEACKEVSKIEPPDLIFDKPFLVLLKCTASDKPYFAMWVDNAEILTPFITNARPSN